MSKEISETSNTRLTPSELAEILHSQRWHIPPGIQAEYPRLSAIARRDFLDILLRVFRAKDFLWVDVLGEKDSPQSLIKASLNLCRDLLIWPWLVVKTYFSAIGLHLTNRHMRPRLGPDQHCLYLRTDHVFDPVFGGALSHTLGVINGMADQEGDVSVFSTSVLNDLSPPRIKLVTPVYGTGRNLPNFPEILYSNQLFEAVSKAWPTKAPSFIYQRYSLGNYTALMLRRAFAIPFVCEYNGSNIWVNRHWGTRPCFHERLLLRIELSILKSADLVTVVSDVLKDELTERGVEESRILVNPNGVNTDVFKPAEAQDELIEKYQLAGKTTIGFIGSFGIWHGAKTLVKAIQALLLKQPEYRSRIKVLLIGDGNMLPVVREEVAELGLEDVFVFVGIVPPDQVINFLNCCDIVTSPHTPHRGTGRFFGSPTKVFEYMAAGKAIVASDIEQIGQILEDKRTALLVPPGDIEKLADAIDLLISEPDLRYSLGEKARIDAVENYSWKIHTQKIIHRLQELNGG